MKIFDSKKSAKLFHEIYESLVGATQARFAAQVRALYDKKLVSENGEYAEFKITVGDLSVIARGLVEKK